MEKYKPTHVLKKDFIAEDGHGREVYKKGTPVAIPKLHRKHAGFCCNVFFLRRDGRFRLNKIGAMAWFSKDFFKPLKDWFEPVHVE